MSDFISAASAKHMAASHKVKSAQKTPMPQVRSPVAPIQSPVAVNHLFIGRQPSTSRRNKTVAQAPQIAPFYPQHRPSALQMEAPTWSRGNKSKGKAENTLDLEMLHVKRNYLRSLSDESCASTLKGRDSLSDSSICGPETESLCSESNVSSHGNRSSISSSVPDLLDLGDSGGLQGIPLVQAGHGGSSDCVFEEPAKLTDPNNETGGLNQVDTKDVNIDNKEKTDSVSSGENMDDSKEDSSASVSGTNPSGSAEKLAESSCSDIGLSKDTTPTKSRPVTLQFEENDNLSQTGNFNNAENSSVQPKVTVSKCERKFTLLELSQGASSSGNSRDSSGDRLSPRRSPSGGSSPHRGPSPSMLSPCCDSSPKHSPSSGHVSPVVPLPPWTMLSTGGNMDCVMAQSDKGSIRPNITNPPIEGPVSTNSGSSPAEMAPKPVKVFNPFPSQHISHRRTQNGIKLGLYNPGSIPKLETGIVRTQEVKAIGRSQIDACLHRHYMAEIKSQAKATKR